MSARPSDIQMPAARPREAQLPSVEPGFGSLQSFELMQRAAKVLSSSDLVPAIYRNYTEVKQGTGRNAQITYEDNPRGLANCIVAMNMAVRMRADPLMVMQNLYVIEGRPSWSSQWIIGQINQCGRFSPLMFDMKVAEAGKDVEYSTFEWQTVDDRRQRVEKKHKTKIDDVVCTAWAIERATNKRIDGPPVSMAMAVKEGWYGKPGSKWQTMPEIMLRYRAAAFFGRLYAPELLMGIPAAEEVHDTIDLTRGAGGTYAADDADLGGARTEVPQPRPRPRQAEDIDPDTGEVQTETPAASGNGSDGEGAAGGTPTPDAPKAAEEPQPPKAAATPPEEKTVPNAEPDVANATASTVEPLRGSQVKILRNRIQSTGQVEAAVAKKFGAATLEQIPETKFNEISAWLSTLSD